MKTQEQFWATYYRDVAKTGNSWLDYSNDRVQAQTFGLALEAAGPVGGKQCVDIGCGWGDFCRTLSVLRAAKVSGVDIVPEVIAQHQQTYPDIEWMCGSLHDPGLGGRLGFYDLAFLLEVLQYAPVAHALPVVWEHLRPGGRIVAVFPNAECPIVRRTRDRFGTNYAPPTLAQIDTVLRGLPDLEDVAYRGLSFAADQRMVPYEVSPWRSTGDWDNEPNRIQFVVVKRGGGG
jgi:2-polyprenyl-3-methyl-5-hydroxy-6-metoxy-1,4-benzoquinol methylase